MPSAKRKAPHTVEISSDTPETESPPGSDSGFEPTSPPRKRSRGEWVPLSSSARGSGSSPSATRGSVPSSSAADTSNAGGYQCRYGNSSRRGRVQSSQTANVGASAGDDTAEGENDDDANADIVGTQGFDSDAYESLQLYGTANTKIVGVRYYNGTATTGEFVVVRREPGNPYDSNAIRIDNVMHQQIGHVPRNMAAKLAPFLDSQKLVAEARLTGPKDFFDAPMEFKLYGTSDRVASLALKQEMKDAKLPIRELIHAEREQKRREKEEAKRREQARKQALKQAAKSAGGLSKQGTGNEIEQHNHQGFANLNAPPNDENDPAAEQEPSMDDILGSTVKSNPREIGKVVDRYGAGEEVLQSLPCAPQPAALKTKLLPFQLQGLAWMLDRENPQLPPPGSSDSTQLWKRGSGGRGFNNVATNYTIMQEPKLASGGILADDMGLGKTLQVLSLLIADPFNDARARRPTLIVSPLSVMSNWSHQAQVHLPEGEGLKVLTYHGNNKSNQRPQDFNQYDVVITTYQTMALEYLPSGSKSRAQPVPQKTGLFSMDWRRIVLDEGHTIRSPKAKLSQAAYNLMATSRWILTGTPIVNSLKDLYSHIKFLRLTGGLEQQDVFSGALIRPLNQGQPEASTLLQALMSTLCLRRMKDMSFVDLRLPELSSHRLAVAFEPQEREKYDAFSQEAKGLLVEYHTRKNAKGENTYSHLLEVLLRMRQTCNHWKLCGDRAANLLALLEKTKKVELNPENMTALRVKLQLSVDLHEECAVCLEPLHSPTITSCKHVFGGECIERVIETQHKCPLCRLSLDRTEDLVRLPEEVAPPSFDADTSSSKIETLLRVLRASRKTDPSTKTVVFSQWTSFLDVVQRRLADESLSFCRLDGTMNAGKRDASMDALANDPTCTVMLASLSVCSVGLNLVAANQVVLADTWWAPAIEDQAVDRVHRLGQTRDVTVFRLVMEDSIEERVIDIQQEKRKLMMMAFREKSMKRGAESRVADIKALLG